MKRKKRNESTRQKDEDNRRNVGVEGSPYPPASDGIEMFPDVFEHPIRPVLDLIENRPVTAEK